MTLKKKDTKKIWNIVNHLTNKKRKHTNINEVMYKNNKISKPLDIATAINEFYTNIANELDQSLPTSNTDPIDILHETIPIPW